MKSKFILLTGLLMLATSVFADVVRPEANGTTTLFFRKGNIVFEYSCPMGGHYDLSPSLSRKNCEQISNRNFLHAELFEFEMTQRFQEWRFYNEQLVLKDKEVARLEGSKLDLEKTLDQMGSLPDVARVLSNIEETLYEHYKNLEGKNRMLDLRKKIFDQISDDKTVHIHKTDSQEYRLLSGLYPNYDKHYNMFCGFTDELDEMNFEEGVKDCELYSNPFTQKNGQILVAKMRKAYAIYFDQNTRQFIYGAHAKTSIPGPNFRHDLTKSKFRLPNEVEKSELPKGWSFYLITNPVE